MWATFGVFARSLYASGYSPAELASVRAWIGFLVVAPFAAARPARLRIRARDLPLFAAYGAIGFALFAWLYFLSVERTTIAVAAALLYTAPAFVVLISRLLWHEPIVRTRAFALVVVLAGVVLVTGAARAIIAGEVGIAPGAALIGLASGATYALYTIFSKLALERTDTTGALFWSFGFAALALLAVAPPLDPLTRMPSALPRLLALGLVPTLLAYTLYLRALRELRASTASMLATIEPVVATLFGAIFFAELIAPEQIAGIVLIVVGSAVIARRAAGS